MLKIVNRGVPLCDGVTRRDWLRIGGLGLGGLALPGLLQQRRAAAAVEGSGAGFGRAKSVILLWLVGGVPQHETWDPKPEGPAEIRGDFGAIATSTPGLFVGELMPRTAKLTDRIAVLRAMVTGDNAHSSSGYQMLTGVPHNPLNRENATPQKPNDYPSLGAMVRALQPEAQGLPPAMTLPRRIANVGEIVWPGQDAGFLGRRFDPWLLTCQPSEKNFRVPAMQLAEDVSTLRFDRRLSLLTQVNRHLDGLERSRAVRDYDEQTNQALSLLTGAKTRTAFELDQEPPQVRERYGMTDFGQSVLLARRLVEAGVSLVHVNWSRIEGKENNGGWDTHRKHSQSLKGWLMPIMDQAYSALLEDLAHRGLLDETLVCWVGEFGHTPRINRNAGRDHWGRVFSIALAGGGTRGGVVHGSTDAQAAHPVSGRVEPCDYTATVLHCLGCSPETTVQDATGRPLVLSRGRVIEDIF